MKDAKSVKVIESKNCKSCSAWLVHVQFKESELIGCIFCDKSLLGYLSEKSILPVNKNYFNNRQPNNSHNNRQQTNNRSNGKSMSNNRRPPMNDRSQNEFTASNNMRNDTNDFSNSPNRGASRGRGRGGMSRGRGGMSRGRGRGRGRGSFSRGDSNHIDPDQQFKQLSYADFIQF